MRKYVGRCSCQDHRDVSGSRENYCCETQVEPTYTRGRNETKPYISNEVRGNDYREVNRCSTCGQVSEAGMNCRCSEQRERCHRCRSNQCRCRRRRSWL